MPLNETTVEPTCVLDVSFTIAQNSKWMFYLIQQHMQN